MLEAAIQKGFVDCDGLRLSRLKTVSAGFLRGTAEGKRRLRGLEQMQFGSSSRVLKVGYVVLLTVFGTLTTRAQYTDFGQALGSSSGQQVTCNPQDLACQAAQQNPADQGNLQRRMPSTNQ